MLMYLPLKLCILYSSCFPNMCVVLCSKSDNHICSPKRNRCSFVIFWCCKHARLFFLCTVNVPVLISANLLQKFSANPEEKFGRWGKKFSPPVIFPFWRNLGLRKTLFLSVWVAVRRFPRIREDKRRKTILLKFGPFSAHFVQNRPKFGRRIVRPLLFYSALFDLCGRTIGQLATQWLSICKKVELIEVKKRVT